MLVFLILYNIITNVTHSGPLVPKNFTHAQPPAFITLPSCPVTAKLGGTATGADSAAPAARRRGRAVASLGKDGVNQGGWVAWLMLLG